MGNRRFGMEIGGTEGGNGAEEQDHPPCVFLVWPIGNDRLDASS